MTAVYTFRDFGTTEAPHWTGIAGDEVVWYSRRGASELVYSQHSEQELPNLLDIRCNTSQYGRLSLLAPEGYKVQCAILVRLQKDEDGTYLVTSSTSTMYGHGKTADDAFEDFRSSLKNYFVRLVRNKDALGIPLKRELEELSRVFVDEA